MKTTLIFCLVIALALSQQCEVSESLRTDCGYLGINQALCEAKSCCWKPTRIEAST